MDPIIQPTCEEGAGPSRRAFLGATSAFAAWAMLPRSASGAGGRDPRFLTVILRGALDGLATVAPLGDPAWADLRPDVNMGGRERALPLDGFFGLNPALVNLHRLYGRGEASVLHAVASPYRGRSHFDGQDVLETGYPVIGRSDSGWLNRALTALEPAEKVNPSGLAIGTTVPLILKGSAPVTSWSPSVRARASIDTTERLLALYDEMDPELHRLFAAGLRADAVALGDSGVGAAMDGSRLRRTFVTAAEGAGRLLAADDGPRVASLSFDGWDTHANEGPLQGRLHRQLDALDGAIAALERTMRPVWQDTVVAIVTEFGRTAAENGTDGTDHGTGAAALLVGGAVRGGRVVADWPGLAPRELFEARDLRPTMDLRSVMAGVLRDHLGLDRTLLASSIFPGTTGLSPTPGLVRG